MKRSITTDFNDELNIIHTNPAQFLLFDNAYPVTICLKPDYFKGNHFDAEEKMIQYALLRNIHFKLYVENENSNVHYHGWISYPFEKIRKNFQVYINRSIGKYHQSKKTDYQDTTIWIEYCMKGEGYYNASQEVLNNIYKSRDMAARPPSPPTEEYVMYLRKHYGFDDEKLQLPERDEMVITSL